MEELPFSTQCPCGSGLIISRCHGRVTEDLLRAGRNTDFPGPPLLKFEQGDSVYRIIRNAIVRRDKRERLHAFTVHWLYWKLGEKWFNEQQAIPEENRHVIARWLPMYWQWNNESYLSPRGGPDRKIIPPGFVNELLSLATDVYTLLLVDALPGFLLKRLKDYNQYQGARYEIAVAAVLVRGGFRLRWKKALAGKRIYEFDATHQISQETIAVEAKSKHRKGAIHQKGDIEDFNEVWRDFISLYGEAVKTRPADRVFAVFIDLNLPHSPTTFGPIEGWSRDILSRLSNNSLFKDSSSPEHSILAITNTAWHYDGTEPANQVRYLAMRPMNAPLLIKNEHTYAAILFALNNFGVILNDY